MKSIPNIQLSVALVTRNRPNSLNRCLKSLRSQNIQPFEIVISDDSDPELAPQTKTIAEYWNCRYVEGLRRGLYANRNNAALACKGTHIRTMDDDHEFPENHFQKIHSILESDPSSVWVIGEYLEDPTSASTFYVPGEIQPRGFSKYPLNPNDCFAISDGAAIYPRQVFDKHRFLEVFKFGSLYLEFGARLKALGYRIRYFPDTYIIHHYILGERSFNDENLQQKAAFLSAYLTYSTYCFSLLRQLECVSYFTIVSILTTLNIKKYNITIFDLWHTWLLANRYIKYFKQGKYNQIV